MPPATMTASLPALLRVQGKIKPITSLLADAVAEGLPITVSPDAAPGDPEESSAIDPALTVEAAPASAAPHPGTSYAGLTPAQRFAFISWCRHPHDFAPPSYQQLFLANLEARLLEPGFRDLALQTLQELGDAPAWAKSVALHRVALLACWLFQDGERLAKWISSHTLPADLLGIAFGLQAQTGTPLNAPELGAAIHTWQLGARLPTELLKLRLDSLASILGQPPLAYAMSQLDPAALAPHPWRTAHRGLRILLPHPDLRSILEPSLRDLLLVADLHDDDRAPRSNLAALVPEDAAPTPTDEQPSLEELGWRLILEFGANRSEYFDYVLVQAQKLPGYSQLMDEDRRIVYRIIFRKSEMRRFWRIWDYVNGWTTARVYLNGNELEKWKVWPYSQYLK